MCFRCGIYRGDDCGASSPARLVKCGHRVFPTTTTSWWRGRVTTTCFGNGTSIQAGRFTRGVCRQSTGQSLFPRINGCGWWPLAVRMPCSKTWSAGGSVKTNLDAQEIYDGAFSSDGKLFAVASGMGYARVWETATWREVATLRGYLLGVHSVAFSGDGKRSGDRRRQGSAETLGHRKLAGGAHIGRPRISVQAHGVFTRRQCDWHDERVGHRAHLAGAIVGGDQRSGEIGARSKSVATKQSQPQETYERIQILLSALRTTPAM